MLRAIIRAVRRLTIAVVVVSVVAGVITCAVFMSGMRNKSPGVQRAVRRMNKAVVNPKMMESPGVRAAIVHHTGRSTGADYHTPVVPELTDDGIVIALPYGTRADWVQNVLTAGRASLTHEGETFDLERPEIVPMSEVEDAWPESERSTHRAFRVEECMRLHRVSTGSGAGSGTGDPAVATAADDAVASVT